MRFLWPLFAIPALAAVIVYPRVAMMVSGAALALGLADSSRLQRLARRPGLLLFLFLVGWHFLMLTCWQSVSQMTVIGMPVGRALLVEAGLVLACGIGGLALLGIAKGYGILGSLLTSRPLLYMGAISYSFYLWHIPVMAFVKKGLLTAGLGHQIYSQFLLLLLSLPVAVVIAAVSHRILEVRLTGLLRRRFARRTPWKAAAPPLQPLQCNKT